MVFPRFQLPDLKRLERETLKKLQDLPPSMSLIFLTPENLFGSFPSLEETESHITESKESEEEE